MRPFKLQQGHDNFSETIENGKNVLREAVLFQVSAPQLRTIFATVITQYQPSNPVSLWSMFRDEFPVDFQYRRRRQLEGEFAELTTDQKEECYHEALRELDLCLRVYGSSLAEIPEMPQPAAIHEGRSFSSLLLRELDRYDSNDLRSRLPGMIASLNPHQRRIFDTIAAAIDSFHNEEDQTENRLFFVDGPGGIGKSFLYNVLLSHVRCKQKVSIAVTTSGIAALLLQVGKTALARSKIPVHDLSSISTCQISIQSQEAQKLKAAELIMWDEASMAHRYAIEAVDRLLRDIMGAVDARLESIAFGGKVVVLGGDFRQTLPVVKLEIATRSWRRI